MLQNSKEEALNQAFKGDHRVGENNIVQELTKAILGEVKRMTGNDVCCDCGAPSEWQSIPSQNILNFRIWKTTLTLDYYIQMIEMMESVILCLYRNRLCFIMQTAVMKSGLILTILRVVGYSCSVLWRTESNIRMPDQC